MLIDKNIALSTLSLYVYALGTRVAFDSRNQF